MITIHQAVLLCFLLAALIRFPPETGPAPWRAATYFVVVIALVYLLLRGVR